MLSDTVIKPYVLLLRLPTNVALKDFVTYTWNVPYSLNGLRKKNDFSCSNLLRQSQYGDNFLNLSVYRV